MTRRIGRVTSTNEPQAAYRPAPAHIDLPALEREVLDLWADQGTFAASLDTPDDAPRWTFYEGPPTGTPGVHGAGGRAMSFAVCSCFLKRDIRRMSS